MARGMKLQFHGMTIGRISCDHKPKKAPARLIALFLRSLLAPCDEFVRSDRARFR